jgi:hypothetical protein
MALKNKTTFSNKDLIILGYLDGLILDIKNTNSNLYLGKQ